MRVRRRNEKRNLVNVILASGSRDFRNRATAESASPLAARLFAVEGVTGVFLGHDFIAVTKESGEWDHLKPTLLGAIMEHFQSGDPVVTDSAGSDTHDAGNNTEIVRSFKELLDTNVRPVVAQDGGDIVFHSFEDGIVYLHMRGACSGCPSSTATLRNGVENLLRHFIPEVQEVRAV
ncbi:MAG: NifU family protein [Alphaproteobacteria bacterium]